MQSHAVYGVVIAVKHHQLRALELVVDERAHIGVVAFKCAGVGEEKFLIHHPHFGQSVVKLIEHPHTVVLDDNAFAVRFVKPLAQVGAVKLPGLFDDLDENVLAGELVGGIFLLALLADDQQGALAAVEALVLKRFLYKLGLAALEKARKEEYGDVLYLTQC